VQTENIEDYEKDNFDINHHWWKYRKIVLGASIQFWGMFILGLFKYCCCRIPRYNEAEERLERLTTKHCFKPTLAWLAGY